MSIAVLLACIGWSATPTSAVAQGRAYESGSAYQGPCTDQQDCGYPMDCAPSRCGDPCDCGPRWTFAAEAIALQRTATRDQDLFLDRNMGDLLNAKDVNFPMAFGPKVSAIRHGVFCSDFDVEVAYFQVDGFELNRYLPGATLMVIDADSAFQSTNSSARYASALYSGEINVRWQWLDWLTLMSGFRMGELNEQYNARGTGTVNLAPISYDLTTYNHLYGYQIGAEGEVYNMGGPLQIKALCKAGIFANSADQNVQALNEGAYYNSLTAINNRTSFLGELGLVANYSITERLAFRASYQAMWLTGVALAPEQIDTTNFADPTASKVNLDGGVFYHGGGLGFEYRF